MSKSLGTLIIVALTLLQISTTHEISNAVTENTNLTNEKETETEVNFAQETSTNEIPPITDSPSTTTRTTTTATTSAANSPNSSKSTTTTPPSPPPSTSSPFDWNNTTTSSPSAAVVTESFDPYCTPSLCELFNGTHIQLLPHVACHNHGNFSPSCGAQPHLLYMSERRRNLILDLHNLARSRIASGQVPGYKPASHMPQIKWDTELEYLATLHAKRCRFTHDQCRNTPRFEYSGQNIGYYWIRREIKSHSRRMKNFVVNWFKEYLDADQTYIDSYHVHPDSKKIGHFTQMVADRVHRVGCAAIRYHEPDQLSDTKFLMTCNYDYTNLFGEPIYQSGPTASKCVYNTSEKYPALCEWKEAVYEYEIEEIEDVGYALDNNDITK